MPLFTKGLVLVLLASLNYVIPLLHIETLIQGGKKTYLTCSRMTEIS